jgi:GDP-4-dehydro-6-deoxy-D-mannose reductase
MGRTFVTGVNGFVASHLIGPLVASGHALVGLGRGEPSRQVARAIASGQLEYCRAGLDDTAVLSAILKANEIDTVVHLAALRQAISPSALYQANIVGAANVLDAIAASARPIRVLFMGSSAMYGDSPDRAPQTEDAALHPVTPYGVSKAAADLMAGQAHVATGLPTFRARPFNVIGPGQRGDYLVAVCARQAAEIERGLVPPVLRLGNLAGYRDFLDVRDLAGAVIAILDRGQPGEAYNVCSGQAVSIQAVVGHFVARLSEAGCEVTVASGPPREGAAIADVRFQVGSYAKLRARTGWQPEVGLERTLDDIFEDWRAELATRP